MSLKRVVPAVLVAALVFAWLALAGFVGFIRLLDGACKCATAMLRPCSTSCCCATASGTPCGLYCV